MADIDSWAPSNHCPAVQERQVWQEEQYPAALQAAQLQVDLSSLPAGDDTEIGAQLGWHMSWLDLQPNTLPNPPKIDLSPYVCVCVCACCCLFSDNTFCRIGWRKSVTYSDSVRFSHDYQLAE